tara:strand:- start:1748 stop:2329 length:582 start_codon:yes stop_codon:yes gene_type:complete
MINKELKEYLDNSIKVKKTLFKNFKEIKNSINFITRSIHSGGKVLIAGNGGSAADAQHLVAEFLVRLQSKVNRKGIAAITLAQDSSTITACSNDYNFELLFARNLETLGSKKDILIVISTSGNSQNIYEVLKVAKKMKIFSIGFFGNKGGKCKKLTNIPIIVDSRITSHIQEAHITLGHFIFMNVEKKIIDKK